MRFLVLVATLLIASLATGFNADAKSIEVLCLIPTDVREDFDRQEAETEIISVMESVQNLYCKQMSDHGFGEKTFTFNRDIDFIETEKSLEDYKNFNTLEADIRRKYPERNPDERILVVFVAGAMEIIRGGFTQSICKPRGCDHRAFIPFANKPPLLVVTAHELGHAFNLKDNSNQDNDPPGKMIMHPEIHFSDENLQLAEYSLDNHEARWLNSNFHFNNRRAISSFPHIDASYAPLGGYINGKAYVRLAFDLTSSDALHQANISFPSGLFLEWDDVTGTEDTAVFLVPKSHLQNVSQLYLQVTNRVGGFNHKMIRFDMPTIHLRTLSSVNARAKWADFKMRE